MEGLRTILVLLIFFVILTRDVAAQKQNRPHIIYILADDLGWNDVGFTGNSELQTPNLDALAYNGRILTRHYSQTLCTPSRTALFTGRYPIRSGMQGSPMLPPEPRALSLNEKLLPQYFKDLGYQTHLVGKWHLGYYDWKYLPTTRGAFDTHFGYWNGFPQYKLRGRYVTDLLTEESVRLIEAAGKKDKSDPLFLFISHLAVHAGNPGDNDLEYPVDDLDRFSYIPDLRRRKLAAMAWNMDKSVGQVVKALADNNMLSNSIIVFASDNGAQTIGGIHTTAFIWSKDLHGKGISRQLFHLTDWLPTLFHAAGGNMRELTGLDGRDQWENLLQEATGDLNKDEYAGREELLVNIEDRTGQRNANYEYQIMRVWQSPAFTAIMSSLPFSRTSDENMLKIRSQAQIRCTNTGWNDVGFTGNSELQTPNLDALAYNGRILTRHYSQPTCTPSRTALFTSRYPIRSGMQGLPLMPPEPRALSLNEKLLPQYFKDLCYQTHLVGKWHLGFYDWKYLPTTRGAFDTFFGFLNGFISYYDHSIIEDIPTNVTAHDFWRNLDPQYQLRGRYVTDLLTEESVRLIEAAGKKEKSEPLFLFISHLAVHAGNPGDNDLEYPVDDLDRFSYIPDLRRRKLAAMAWNLDKSVGQVVKSLADNNMLSNSIIVFASDNGARTIGKFRNDGSNYPFRGVHYSKVVYIQAHSYGAKNCMAKTTEVTCNPVEAACLFDLSTDPCERHYKTNKFVMEGLRTILFLLTIFLTLSRYVAAEKQNRPHVIYILADDLGWNDVGFTGNSDLQTPNLDALAYNGRILTRHYTQTNVTAHDFWRNLEPQYQLRGRYVTDLLTEESIRLIEAAGKNDKSDPLFLFISHLAIHAGNPGDNDLEYPVDDLDRFSYILDIRRRKLAGISRQLFHLTDWLPTLFHAAGGNVRELTGLDGRDQWENLLQKSTGDLDKDEYAGREELLVNIEDVTGQQSVIYRNWKLIR
ncbi:hypothetical protein B566_EDAN008642 [Ephemera danica]|nr:hypothetical protein B566_EDAN008642 [Ephemera danica]